MPSDCPLSLALDTSYFILWVELKRYDWIVFQIKGNVVVLYSSYNYSAMELMAD